MEPGFVSDRFVSNPQLIVSVDNFGDGNRRLRQFNLQSFGSTLYDVVDARRVYDFGSSSISLKAASP